MPSLRDALTTIHQDRQWWRKVLLGGALMLTLVGYPLATGMVIVSMENSRRGFPTPLPPWFDWSTRYLMGIFALLIDFVFFVLPMLIAGLLFLCIGMIVLISSGTSTQLSQIMFRLVSGGAGLFIVLMFLSSVSPVARLMFVDHGHIEDALSMQPLLRVFSLRTRGYFLRARLASLVAYLPAILLGLVFSTLARFVFPGSLIVLLIVAWLILSAIFYAHLVTTQLYVTAEQEIEQANQPIRLHR